MAQPEWLALTQKGMRWQRLKQPARAIECLTQSLELMRRESVATREIADTLNYLGMVYLHDGQMPQAEATLREAIESVHCLPLDQHHLAADDYMLLAESLSKQGRHQEALEVGEQGLALHRQRQSGRDFVRKVKETVKQLKRNLADAEKRKRKAVRAPSRSM